MKYAVIADIHGNYYAFEEVIKNIVQYHNVNGFIFLGDYCTDFPNWNETISLIRKIEKSYDTHVIKGNRENTVINFHNNPEMFNWSYENTNGLNLFGYNNLSNDNYLYIENLEDEKIVDIDGTDKLYLSHDKPNKDKIDFLKQQNISIVLSGHSHVDGEEIEDNIRFLNPGSIGMTDLGKIGATFGIIQYDNSNWKFKNYTIPYNYDATINEIKNNKVITAEAKIWGDYLIASVLTGYSLTPIFVRESYRLGRIYIDSKENEIIPDYSAQYEKNITKVYKLIKDYIDPKLLPKELWTYAKQNMNYYLKNDFPNLFNNQKDTMSR